jgi:putative FmdB family regulatory protein
MPTYEYRCAACGKQHEFFQAITERPKKKCPSCKKSGLQRLISAGAGFLFKGQGFYITDYRSESYKAGQKSESAPAAPATEGKRETAKGSEASPSQADAKKPSTEAPKKSGPKGK